MSDRIARAWQFRKRIHAWLLDHAGANMRAMVDAMRPMPKETTRKAVAQLVDYGNIIAHGSQTERIYSAVAGPINGESSTRIILQRSGRQRAAMNLQNMQNERNAYGECVFPKTTIDPRQPWRTVNCADGSAYAGQGGQGARACMPLGMSVLESGT